ncbi:MAG: hypothetical protein EBT14_06025 [Betaproteobacteria bacterium]|nr:hypothetical protein [Betaproteobacteria bacterium]
MLLELNLQAAQHLGQVCGGLGQFNGQSQPRRMGLTAAGLKGKDKATAASLFGSEPGGGMDQEFFAGLQEQALADLVGTGDGQL